MQLRFDAFARTAVEQAARGDGIALICAHRAAEAGDIDALVRIDEQVYARKLSDEMRTMSVRMGKKFTEMGVGDDWRAAASAMARMHRDVHYPGMLSGGTGGEFRGARLPAIQAFVVHQYGVATTILGAALRLMRISHVETQKILYELNGRVEAAYEIAAATRLVGHGGLCAIDGNPGRGSRQGARAPVYELKLAVERRMSKKITRIGIGGPVGSGKTAIVEAITPRLLDLGIKVLIITNDVVTTEDAKHVQRTLKGILLEERILGRGDGCLPSYGSARGSEHEPRGGRGHGTALSG